LENIITSRENPAIKQIVKLSNSAKFRRELGLFVLEGLRLCRDAALSGHTLKSVYFTEAFYDAHPQDLKILKEKSETSFLVSSSVMEKMSDTVNSQGVIALCEIPKFPKTLGEGFYVGLENISNPSNLGAISRSAEAFGAKGLVLFGTTCDPYSPKSLRAGMGALLRLPVLSFSDFDEVKVACEAVGKKTFSAVVDEDAERLTECEKPENSLLIIGNEANGITKETAQKSYKRITIPMSGRAESLNAASAAAVLIWEFTK